MLNVLVFLRVTTSVVAVTGARLSRPE